MICYNPFPLLHAALLKGKISEGKRYFVRQSYPRGRQGKITLVAMLLTGYSQKEESQALEHISALGRDPCVFLYDATNPEHLSRLLTASRQLPGYPVYYAGKTGKDWDPPREYQIRLQRYVREYLPGWKPRPGGPGLKAGLFDRQGNLFVKLSFEDETVQVPLEIIEGF
jgi:hypothetical protein